MSTTTLRGVSVNFACCHGCGACAETAPDIFEMDPDTDLPIILREEAPEEVLEQAMAYCPNDCIEMD